MEVVFTHANYMHEQIEKHELLEMRRVAAYIYKKAGRWKQSIALSKKDNLYKDCMETCSQSGDRELSEDLLVYFIEQACFISLSLYNLYVCVYRERCIYECFLICFLFPRYLIQMALKSVWIFFI